MNLKLIPPNEFKTEMIPTNILICSVLNIFHPIYNILIANRANDELVNTKMQ